MGRLNRYAYQVQFMGLDEICCNLMHSLLSIAKRPYKNIMTALNEVGWSVGVTCFIGGACQLSTHPRLRRMLMRSTRTSHRQSRTFTLLGKTIDNDNRNGKGSDKVKVTA